MTDQQHPITPPPELVAQWRNSPEYITGLQPMSMVSLTTDKLQDIATQAARWGADQELEACCAWLKDTNWDELREAADDLRADRRPKPPSLKEQALEAMGRLDNEEWCQELEIDLAVVRKALESLPS